MVFNQVEHSVDIKNTRNSKKLKNIRNTHNSKKLKNKV